VHNGHLIRVVEWFGLLNKDRDKDQTVEAATAPSAGPFVRAAPVDTVQYRSYRTCKEESG
jgi:hypothetical protein